MNNITVNRVQADEIPAAANFLSYAFLTQPNNIAIWRGQDESARQKIEVLFRIAKLERHVSHILAARKDNQLLGILNMVESPHCQASLLENLKLLPRLLALSVTALPRLMKIQLSWKKHDPEERHWHLGPIGVSPNMQGQGIGSRMLEKCCETIDHQKKAVYLETDKAENVAFYERFGFKVIEEESILGVPNWFMWRLPR